MKIPLHKIEGRLLIVLEQSKGLLPANEIEEMKSLVKAGEPGVGFENFCTQLFGYDVKAPRPVIAELATLGEAMGIDPHYWKNLLKLID